MPSPLRRDYSLIALLGFGAVLTFGAQHAAKGRVYTKPATAALPLDYHGWKGSVYPEDKGAAAILPNACIDTIVYTKPGVSPVAVVLVGSRDPNDMHTPERCFVGGGFEVGNVERREIKVTQPEPKSFLFNLMTVKNAEVKEMVLYGYDGVQMLGSSTFMARVMMKLRGPSENPAYFVRLSTQIDDPVAAEKRLTEFAQNLMNERASWERNAGVKP